MEKTFPSRPALTERDAERVALTLYGLRATACELPSEHDRNFHLSTDGGEQVVLKVANSAQDATSLQFQNRMMDHLASRGLTGAISEVLAARSGQQIETTKSADGTEHPVRMLTYLPGEPLADIRHPTEELFRSLGELLGKIDVALTTFSDAWASREYQWDLQRAAETIDQRVRFLKETGQRALVEHFMTLYASRVEPHLSDLRTSVIHNDANDYNVLVSAVPGEVPGKTTKRVTGILDFGDALHSHVVNEPAVAMAYAMLDESHPLTAAAAVVGGYHSINPLTDLELELLFPLVCTRLCLSVAICARQKQEEPDNDYLRVSERPAWALLEQLKDIDPDVACYTFRRACGLEPCPHSGAALEWLKNNQHQISHLIDFDLRNEALPVLNLSFANPELSIQDEAAYAKSLNSIVEETLTSSSAEVAFGRYGEVRVSPPFRTVAGNSESLPPRAVSLGADLYMNHGSSVYAPIDGTIFRVERSGPIDGKAEVILEHTPHDGVRFYTRYAHMSRDSLLSLNPDHVILKGQKIGRTHDSDDQERVPRLWFQIITETPPAESPVRAACPVEDKDVLSSLYPDPNVILQAPSLAANVSNESSEAILRERSELIGPSLSISYKRPLNIVRGFMQYLYDADGRAYLDSVNNVPHVGHCHPYVVDAARKQLAVLNTNTRYLHRFLVEYARRLTSTLPDPLSVCYLVCSGSEANELALRLARAHTGGTDVIVVDGAYHGNTSSLVDISPYKFDGPGGSGAPPHVHKVPTPDCYRGIHRGELPNAGEHYAGHVEDVVRKMSDTGCRLAAFICEPVMGCAGQIVLPQGYLETAYHHVRAAGGVCIADEVQVGFGRAGTHFWAFETQAVVPDIVTLGKPIGNGHPLAAVITTPAIAASFNNGMEYFNTFGGNPVSCAIGMAVLDVIEDEHLQQRALETGVHLRTELEKLKEQYDVIGDVRGLGLFIGIELVLDREKLTPATDYASYVVERMKDYGVLVSTDGPLKNVIKIKPPLVFTQENAECLIDTLARVLYDAT